MYFSQRDPTIEFMKSDIKRISIAHELQVLVNYSIAGNLIRRI